MPDPERHETARGAHPLDLVERWIAAHPSGLLGLQVSGPSGIGKTHFVELCREKLLSSGCPVATVRGSETPVDWQTIIDEMAAGGSGRGALLIDEAHLLTPESLQRVEKGLARFPAVGLVILVGCARPCSYWILTPFQRCFHQVAFPPFTPQEGRAYLVGRGLDPVARAEALGASHGNFAALVAEADARVEYAWHGDPPPLAGQAEYLRRVLANAPRHIPQRGMELACRLGQVTQELLLTFLPDEEARVTIDWLRRSLDFVPLLTGMVPSRMGRNLLWKGPPAIEVESARRMALSRARELVRSEDTHAGLLETAACLHLFETESLKPDSHPVDLGALEIGPFGPEELAEYSPDEPGPTAASVLAIRDRSARPLGVLREWHLSPTAKLAQFAAHPSLRRAWWWLHDHRRLWGGDHARFVEGEAFPSPTTNTPPWPGELVFRALLHSLARQACVATFVSLPDPETWCTVVAALGGRLLPGDGIPAVAVFLSSPPSPLRGAEGTAYPTWTESSFHEAVNLAFRAAIGQRLPPGHPLLHSRIVTSRLDDRTSPDAALHSLLREQVSALHWSEEGAKVFPVARRVFLLDSSDRSELARTVGLTSRTVTRHLRRAEQIVASKLWTEECGTGLESMTHGN